MAQEREDFMNKEAERLYETFVQDREIFRRGFKYADEHPDPDLKKSWMDKACEWLESINLDYYQIIGGVFNTELVDDFKKYMENDCA